ncbi:MAG: TetR/AcrR family transcriptional regulator [Rhodothermaceae bacterium]
MPRKEREIKLRRQYIVDVAQELFKKYGYENTSMDDIAKESEFSKTTLYKYFKSKEELSIYVYRKIHLEKMAVLRSFIDKGKTGADKLYQFAQAYIKFFAENPDALRFQLAWDYKGINKEIISKEQVEEIFSSYDYDFVYLNDIIVLGKKDGSFREDLDNEAVLDTYYLLLRSLLNQMLFIKNNNNTVSSLFVDERSSYDSFVEIFIKGLKPGI